METMSITKGNRIDKELVKLTAKFETIKGRVDNDMMKEASLITGDSHTSYWRYLNGEVKKIAVAKRMLSCLTTLLKKHAA